MRVICDDCVLGEWTERTGWRWCREIGGLVKEKETCDKAIFECDPEKNTECRKTSCYLNGGICRHTKRKECAIGDA